MPCLQIPISWQALHGTKILWPASQICALSIPAFSHCIAFLLLVRFPLSSFCCSMHSLSKGACLSLGLLNAQVPADASGGHVTITCHFNQTASTEVQVTPAAAAQQSDTGPQTAQPPVDDLTDDFAAGDAAVQVPVCFSLVPVGFVIIVHYCCTWETYGRDVGPSDARGCHDMLLTCARHISTLAVRSLTADSCLMFLTFLPQLSLSSCVSSGDAAAAVPFSIFNL